MRRALPWVVLSLVLLAVLVGACAPAASPSQAPAAPSAAETAPIPATPSGGAAQGSATQVPAAPAVTQAPQATTAPQATQGMAPSPTAAPAIPTVPAVEVQVEQRVIELEWPASLRLGSSDVLRLSLVPSTEGYTATAEFPEHTLQTKPVQVRRPLGYSLLAVARLDGVNFTIAPSGDQPKQVPPDESVSWRWSLTPQASGQQRLSLVLTLHWQPEAGGLVKESQLLDRTLDVRVTSFLGLTPSQAASGGLVGLALGGGMLLVSLIARPARRKFLAPPGSTEGGMREARPNPSVMVETGPRLSLTPPETALLQSLFPRHARLVLEKEFLSGYSGARTFLLRPVKSSGEADAPTIVKLGTPRAISAEYHSYETYVKDRLPPITARIQNPPVVLPNEGKAALQYTFIAAPGEMPVSLEDALRRDPDPALLQRLFDTFAPYWWMQKRPAVFRLEQEYDSLLPPHYLLESTEDKTSRLAGELDQDCGPHALHLHPGDRVRLGHFDEWDRRPGPIPEGTLRARPQPGGPSLRLRVRGERPRPGAVYRVIDTRAGMLAGLVDGFDRLGLRDPLARLPERMSETVSGACSVIHGDLNLQNALYGPGQLVWLIDFARTREGHPLFDFAHLEAELIAHIVAPAAGSPRAYLDLWQSGGGPLLESVHAAARRCLFDPTSLREWQLSLWAACIGALKYVNLPHLGKECLYLTAAAVEAQL